MAGTNPGRGPPWGRWLVDMSPTEGHQRVLAMRRGQIRPTCRPRPSPADAGGWSGRRESNPQPRAPKARALPIAPRPDVNHDDTAHDRGPSSHGSHPRQRRRKPNLGGQPARPETRWSRGRQALASGDRWAAYGFGGQGILRTDGTVLPGAERAVPDRVRPGRRRHLTCRNHTTGGGITPGVEKSHLAWTGAPGGRPWAIGPGRAAPGGRQPGPPCPERHGIGRQHPVPEGHRIRTPGPRSPGCRGSRGSRGYPRPPRLPAAHTGPGPDPMATAAAPGSRPATR